MFSDDLFHRGLRGLAIAFAVVLVLGAVLAILAITGVWSLLR